MLGVAIVVTVYLLANYVYIHVLGVEQLGSSTAPAAVTMRALLGPAGEKVIAAGIALSTFGFLNLVILVTPRVLQTMAADGVFFRRFAVLHPTYQTPAAAIVALATFAVILTVTGTFGQLVDYVTFGDWIFFGLTVAGLLLDRFRFGPAVFVVAAAYVVISVIISNPGYAARGALLIALGVPAYLYWRTK